MMPSMPRLRTPARSEISSPIVAKISGEAMRTTAAQKSPRAGFRRASSSRAAARKRVSMQRRDHGEERAGDHDVGDDSSARPAARLIALAPTKMPATKIAASTTAKRMSMRQHRDDDAGVAEARRQIERQVALQAGDLGETSEAASPPDRSAVFSMTALTGMPAKAAACAILADRAHFEAERGAGHRARPAPQRRAPRTKPECSRMPVETGASARRRCIADDCGQPSAIGP